MKRPCDRSIKYCSALLILLMVLVSGCAPVVEIESAQRAPIDFEQMVEQANKSAVTIIVRSDEVSDVASTDSLLANIRSHGSGVIVTKDGYIATAYHVVNKYTEKGERIENFAVILHDREVLVGRLVGAYERYDLALLKIEAARGFAFSEIGDADELLLGESVITIGTPKHINNRNSVQKGIVSSLDKRGVYLRNGMPGDALFQIDIPVADGSSGSAVFNMKGEVVGIVRGTNTEAPWLSTAVISNLVAQMIQALQTNKAQGQDIYFIEHPCLGIEGKVFSRVKREGEHPLRRGFLISTVNDNSTAYEAGLRERDVITKLDDIVLDREDLIFLLAYHGYAVGDVVNVTVYRRSEGKYLTFETELVPWREL